VNKCAIKKRALFNHLCRSNDFFVVKACTPVHMRVRQSKNCKLENKRRLVWDYFGHGESESGPQSTIREIANAILKELGMLEVESGSLPQAAV
jgi:hypothetical protein